MVKPVLKWVKESELKPFYQEVKHAVKDLHYALLAFGEEMEAIGYSNQEIQRRLKNEFLLAAREVIREEGF